MNPSHFDKVYLYQSTGIVVLSSKYKKDISSVIFLSSYGNLKDDNLVD